MKTEGDSFMVAFHRATDAVQAALEITLQLAQHPWPEEIGAVRVRIGLHTGEPFVGYDEEERVDYFGPMVNRAARVAQAGHGGQILVSSATYDVAREVLSRDIELLNLGLHRLRGLERPERLYQVGHPLLSDRSFPPLRTLDAVPHGLPVRLTSFVGREAELEQLRALIRQPSVRLVTLLGPGGIGKSRLALEAAADTFEDFPDGVWCADLSTLTHEDEVAPHLAALLPFVPEPEPCIADQVISYLTGRRLLLVLDGFEPVLGAADLVLQILQATSQVHLLVTSRALLRVLGEQAFPLAPLALPPAGEAPERLLQYDSVSLFSERARLVKPDWSLTANNAAAVGSLCRRLDGLPLAIELAAARVSALTPRQILSRLEGRLDLLASEARGLPERLRTLRATIDWSYHQLSEQEQRVLGRLAVFRGGFFMEAAEAICGPEALQAVIGLRDHSLLYAQEAAGRMRYLMLESIQQYAVETLEEAGPVRAAHAHCLWEEVRALAARLSTGEEMEALELFALELDNLRAAVQWARDAGHDDLLAQLAAASSEPLRRLGGWRERLEWLQEGVAAAARSGTLPAREQAQLRYALGVAHRERGEFEAAQQQLEASLQTFRHCQEVAGEADGLKELGNLLLQRGHCEEARRHYEDAVLLCRMQGDRTREARLLNNLGVLAIRHGDLEEAHRCFRHSLQIDREAGNTTGIALMLNNLGRVAFDLGRLEEAEELLQESRGLKDRLGDRWGLAHTLHNLGDVARARRQLEAARDHYRQALCIRLELEANPEIAESLLGLARLLMEEARWMEAVLLLTAAEDSLAGTGAPELEAATRALQELEASVDPTQYSRFRAMAQRFTLDQVARRTLEM